MSPALHVVLHGHFYQPPREDPGTDGIPVEPSAAPFHDWNQRIHEECYAPVVAARLLGGGGRVRRLVNTLEWMSFDAAPTLLRWLEREAPATYRAFLEGDAAGARRTGHGNALATSYHHVILPLASPADRRTEIRWGVRDFRDRFGREPAGFWLPEAATDTDTLEAVAREGLAFVVLGQGQVVQAPPRGLPGRVTLAGGRDIAVVVYDGGLSHGISFGGMLRDAGAWGDQILARHTAGLPAAVTLATDGETFGHHHTFGEMALASLLARLADEPGVQVTNAAALLASHPPEQRVELVEPSSWSCPHGVDRWRRDCGCRAAPERPSSQAWRAPLRSGLDGLGEALHVLYRDEAGALVPDPDATRDRFAAVLEAGEEVRVRFAEAEAGRALDAGERRRVLELLEMQRAALRMFTSCAWFFDDLSGIEPRLAMRAAAHALELAGPGGAAAEAALRVALGEADRGVGRVPALAGAAGGAPDGARADEAHRDEAARRGGSSRSSVPGGASAGLPHAGAERPDSVEGGTTAERLWLAETGGPSAPARVAGAVALARAAGLAPPERVGSWSVALEPGGLRLRDGRTGAESTWSTRVRAGDGPSAAVRRRDQGDGDAPGEIEVVPGDLTWPWDERVPDAWAARPLEMHLDPAERTALLAGRWSVDAGRARALARALDALPGVPTRADLAPLAELLRALAGGAGIPLQVQAALWRAWRRSPAVTRPLLRPLLHAAGMEPDPDEAP
jgi:hypothetical protein